MSLRGRLLLALGVAVLVALAVADVVTYSVLRSSLIGQVDQTLARAFPEAAPGFGGGGRFGPPPAGVVHDVPGAFVEQRDADGAVVFKSPAVVAGGHTYEPALPRQLTVPGEATTYFSAPATTAGGPPFRVLVAAMADGSQLVVALPLSSELDTLHRLWLTEVAVTGAALLAAVALGWWLVRLGLRPLAAVEETAAAIASGALDRRVPGAERRTEVGRLARSLNLMLGRIEQAFSQRLASEARLRQSEERMRRFVADASHELRTPLAAVSAYAELFTRGAGRRPADLDRVMAGIGSETERMKVLVEDLVLLAHLDEGRPLSRQPVELVALCADAVHAAQAVGPGWPLELVAEAPLEVLGDPARLRQVVDNLLANVRAHTPPGTRATVKVRAEGDRAVLEVLDAGPGLDPEAGRHVFERFYRADPSRARATGGAGLGLSIVAAIVAAHGGQVAVGPGPAGGLAVKVDLPTA